MTGILLVSIVWLFTLACVSILLSGLMKVSKLPAAICNRGRCALTSWNMVIVRRSLVLRGLRSN